MFPRSHAISTDVTSGMPCPSIEILAKKNTGSKGFHLGFKKPRLLAIISLKMVKFLIESGAIIDKKSIDVASRKAEIGNYFQSILKNK